MICRSPQWLLHDVSVWGKLHLGYLYMNRFAELMVPKPGAGLTSTLLATLLTPLVCNIRKKKFRDSFDLCTGGPQH